MAAILPGTLLGRYEIHEHLGAGTFGPLHRAREPTLATVTVQLLSGLSDDALPALYDLAARLVALRHRNLAGVLDYGEHEGSSYLVVEYAPGGTLLDRMRNGPISVEAALRFLAGVAEGLDHAHAHGLVHGGLRPELVLLAGDHRALVSDVGLASLRRPVGALPPDLSAGQAAYRAPEQAAAVPPTAGSDHYALSALAYHLLTGSVPFSGGAADVLTQADVQPAPSSLNPALGAATDQVLLRGLARHPRARWETGVQMVAALRDALALDDVVPAAGKPAARWPWAAAAGVVVVVAALAGFLAWQTHQSTGPSVNRPFTTAPPSQSPTSSPLATPATG